MTIPTDREIVGLVGHRFPGGTRTVGHWENWLLTDCTRRPPMPRGLLHPVVLFNVPIEAVGTSIAELFELGQSDGRPGAVTLLGYDWEYLQPMFEDVEYRAEGGIIDVTRHVADSGEVLFDDVAYSIEMTASDATQVAACDQPLAIPSWRAGTAEGRAAGGKRHADPAARRRGHRRRSHEDHGGAPP